ncbi:MAG: hypothetical protein O3A51_03525 [Verrucomicrobia bacterium]|nr:hypothetical protein [Verrucomicrobiota bacterium]
MSLKTIHIVFVVCALILLVAFGVWCRAADPSTFRGVRVTGWAAFTGAALLSVYGFRFVKSLKRLAVAA